MITVCAAAPSAGPDSVTAGGDQVPLTGVVVDREWPRPAQIGAES